MEEKKRSKEGRAGVKKISKDGGGVSNTTGGQGDYIAGSLG